ncbi:hypothetical protein [Solidesulfovibrio sp.]
MILCTLSAGPGRRIRFGRLLPVAVLMVLAAVAAALPAPARAATWYVDAAASGGDGTSWATAFAAIQTGLAAAKAGDTVEVAGGLYSEALSTVRAGVTVAGSTAAGRNSPATVRGGNGQTVLAVAHQTVWRRLSFDGSSNADLYTPVVQITAGGPTFEQCTIGPGQRLLAIGSGGATFSRTTIQDARRGNRVYGQVVDINAASDPVVFNYCLFGDMEYGYLQPRTASRIELNNCLLAGFFGDMLYLPETASVPGGVHLKNCLALGNGFAAGAIVENLSAGAPVTLTNCLIQDKAPVAMAEARFLGDVAEVSPLAPGSPKLAQGRRAARLNIGIDDAVNIGFWTQLNAVAAGYGMRTTLALDAANATSGDWTALQTGINAGHEVAAHSARHVYLPETRLMTLAYAGSGSGATVAVTSSGTAATSLTVAADSDPAANFSLDLAAAATDTIGEVCAVINAKAGFTCELVTISGTTYTSAPVLSRDLAAVPGASIQHVTAVLSRNDAQFFADEIAAPKAVIETNLTAPGSAAPYACTSFVYPFLGVDAAVLAATAGAGFTAARGGYDGSYAMGGLYAGTTPGSYDTLNIWAVQPGTVFGRNLDAATLARRVSAFLEWAKFTGAAVSLFSHGAGEYALAEWSALLALVAADTQVQTATLAGIRQYVAENAQSRSGSTFTRTVWPDAADYRPVPGSPLLRAGAVYAVSLTDFGGAAVPAGTSPNVGLYQGLYAPGAAVPAVNVLLLLQ